MGEIKVWFMMKYEQMSKTKMNIAILASMLVFLGSFGEGVVSTS